MLVLRPRVRMATPGLAVRWLKPERMMFPFFADRHDAGRRLGARLGYLTNRARLIVLALHRGAVPVGYEVATALGAPLDVFVLGVPRPDLRGATVVLVDDGMASESTMLAAAHALHELGPAAVIVAAPVMSPSALTALAQVADVCECIVTPEPLDGVGMWYHDFTQTTDDEVRTLLPHATHRSRYAGRS